jgi:hypothetical protein
MATAVKRKLTGSTDGKGIKITQTATAGDAIHTAVAGTTAGTFDEIYLYAANNHTADVTLTVEFGSADTENNFIVDIPYKAGQIPVLEKLILQNEATVKAFASVANVVTIHGYVNAITD